MSPEMKFIAPGLQRFCCFKRMGQETGVIYMYEKTCGVYAKISSV